MLCWLCRLRTAESKLADAELKLKLKAPECKLSPLSQLLDPEKATAKLAVGACELSWQALLDHSSSAAAVDARAAAEKGARAFHSAVQQQPDDSCADRAV